MIDPAVWADPYPFYERLRRERPVWLVPGLDLAYVATHDLIVDAVRRIDDFSSHLDMLVITGDDGYPDLFHTEEFGEGTTTLATADPPEHTVHRSLVFPRVGRPPHGGHAARNRGLHRRAVGRAPDPQGTRVGVGQHRGPSCARPGHRTAYWLARRRLAPR